MIQMSITTAKNRYESYIKVQENEEQTEYEDIEEFLEEDGEDLG